MSKSEKTVEKRIKDFCNIENDTRSFCFKIFSGGEQGKDMLDLIGAYNGIPFNVEAKREDGGVTSTTQRGLIAQARKGGYVSDVVSSLDEFKRLFESRLNGDNPLPPMAVTVSKEEYDNALILALEYFKERKRLDV